MTKEDSAAERADSADSADSETGGEPSTLSNDERRKLIARIKKLFARGYARGDVNSPEADLARVRAHDLMSKHGLHIKDVFPDIDREDETDDETRVEVWPKPIAGSTLVGDIQQRLRAHVIMQPEHYLACALWVLHAHCHDAAMHTPILLITAPTLGCGKTNLLECLEYMVPRPMPTGHTTAASLYSAIDQEKPTLLIDEVGTFATKNMQLRNILNHGHKRGGVVTRMNVATRMNVKYSVWAPKAMALNAYAQLHPEIQSRSIIIDLKRKAPDEEVTKPKQPRDLYDDQDPFNIIRMKCARWQRDNIEKLQDADPELPLELDRDNDNWRPLIAIADLCKCGDRARNVAVAITKQQLQEPDIREQLLRAIKPLFVRHGSPLPSQDIVRELLDIEDGPWKRDRLNVTSLSHLLKPFNIRPREVRLAGRRAQCYRVEQFDDAFARYCPSPQKPNKARHPRHPRQRITKAKPTIKRHRLKSRPQRRRKKA